jgi:hypothetical protein
VLRRDARFADRKGIEAEPNGGVLDMSVTDRIEPDGHDDLASLPVDPDVLDAGEEHSDDDRAARYKDFLDWLNDSA